MKIVVQVRINLMMLVKADSSVTSGSFPTSAVSLYFSPVFVVPSPNRGTKSIHLPFLQTEAGAQAGLQVSAEKATKERELWLAIKIIIIVRSIFFICFLVV